MGLVHGHLREPLHQLGAAVARNLGLEKLWPFIYKVRGQLTRCKGLICQHGLQEVDVGRYPADSKLRKRALTALNCAVEVPAPGNQLHQHRVKVRRHLGTGGYRSTVQANARSTRRSVGGDLSGVRPEASNWILSGDSTLHCKAVWLNVTLAQAQLF